MDWTGSRQSRGQASPAMRRAPSSPTRPCRMPTLLVQPLTQQMLVIALRPPGLEESFAKTLRLLLDPPMRQEFAEHVFACPLGSRATTGPLTLMPELAPSASRTGSSVAGIHTARRRRSRPGCLA